MLQTLGHQGLLGLGAAGHRPWGHPKEPPRSCEVLSSPASHLSPMAGLWGQGHFWLCHGQVGWTGRWNKWDGTGGLGQARETGGMGQGGMGQVRQSGMGQGGTGWDGTGQVGQGGMGQVGQGGTIASPSQAWPFPGTSSALGCCRCSQPGGIQGAHDGLSSLVAPGHRDGLLQLPSPLALVFGDVPGFWGCSVGSGSPQCPGMGVQQPWERAGSPGDAQGCRAGTDTGLSGALCCPPSLNWGGRSGAD